MSNISLLNGDCLQILKTLQDNSIDSVVTDPPYGISFMNKHWDYDVPTVEVWQEVFRVLKPGGHILCACGTRTQHRMTVNIEDAGFEIRDVIAWIYGSGFPKSLNIGKAIDEYEGWGTALKPAMELWTLARKPLSEKTVATNVLKWGTGGINIDGCRVEFTGQTDSRMINGWSEGQDSLGHEGNLYKGGYKEGYVPQSSQLGRFPANVIHDGSDEVESEFAKAGNKGAFAPVKSGQKGFGGEIYGKYAQAGDDGATFYNDGLGSASRFFYCAKASKSERNKGTDILKLEKEIGHNRFDKCSICGGYILQNQDRPSACTCEIPQREHNSIKGNFHPTVKPVSLMRYLCRLITSKNGTVLDPYMGSGSTGIGAKVEGFSFIGIERESDYCKIAQARIDTWEEECLPKPKLIEPTLF